MERYLLQTSDIRISRSKINKMKIVYVILLSVLTNHVFAQPYIDKARNMYRDGDRLIEHQTDFSDFGTAGKDAVWNLDGMKTIKKKHTVTYKSVPLFQNRVSCTECGTRYYYDLRFDSLPVTGYENNLTKMDYDVPELSLLFPMHYGDSIGGCYSGRGRYCDKISLRSFGKYAVKADASGILILPDGDTLRHVLRIHTERMTYRLFYPADSVKNDSLKAFTADSVEKYMTLKSNTLIRQDYYRWYAAGYRYPVLEAVTTGTASGKASSTYYYPPSEQQYLSLDDENKTLREKTDEEGNVGKKDGSNVNPVDYNLSQDRNAKTVTVKYSLKSDSEINFILADITGIVYRTESKTGEAGIDYTVSMSYEGLRRHSQYIIYICVNGCKYAEKFNAD